MLNKKVILWNVILFIVFGGASLVFGLPGMGAMAVIFGIINGFRALIFLIEKSNDKALSCLLIGGIFLLVGFGLCSQFVFNIR